MRFRMGLMVGFGAGYYLGAKAGRERFEQLDRVLTKVKESEAVDTATEKAKAVIDLGVERARDVIESRQGSDGDDHGGTGQQPAGIPDREIDEAQAGEVAPALAATDLTESVNGSAAAASPDQI